MEIRVRLSIDKPADPQNIQMWVEEIRWSYKHNDLQTYTEIRNLGRLAAPQSPPRDQMAEDGVMR